MMAYAEGGDLCELIKEHNLRGAHFTESQVLTWFAQIVSAISYLHSFGIMHRDLKTANVFFGSSEQILLGDFGIACAVGPLAERQSRSTPVGTPMYMAPEIVKGRTYDQKADIWALGCILFELMQLFPAFTASSLSTLLHRIQRGRFNKNFPPHFSQELIGMFLQKLGLSK